MSGSATLAIASRYMQEAISRLGCLSLILVEKNIAADCVIRMSLDDWLLGLVESLFKLSLTCSLNAVWFPFIFVGRAPSLFCITCMGKSRT